jgi:hypothetical protein
MVDKIVTEEPATVALRLSATEVKFLLAAVWNYDAFGPPRPDVMRKLKTLLTEEEMEKAFEVYGPPQPRGR